MISAAQRVAPEVEASSPTPGLVVECVVFGLDDEGLKVLLLQRRVDPFRGRWALPGGPVRLDETLEKAARRRLDEQTGVGKVFLEQLYTFGGLDRSPGRRLVSVAYYALVRMPAPISAPPGGIAEWFAVESRPRLAFDHDDILATALGRLKGKLRYQPIGFELLPPKFSLSQLQRMYERILGRPLDKRNFRKRILRTGLLRRLDEVQADVSHRAARLYRFDREKYLALTRKGIDFEL